MKKGSYWVILAYDSFDADKHSHRFMAHTKREVVGLMKTVMDNFDPAHVDIMSSYHFYKKNKKEELQKTLEE